MIEAVRKWQHFLKGRYFTIVTDQEAISFMFDQRHHGKIEKPYLASAPSSLKPAVVDSLLDNFPVHILVDSGASKNFVDFKICQKLHLAI